MKVEFSRPFMKAASSLSGKLKRSLHDTIKEVEAARKLEDITDCKKLVGYKYIYRIRIGSYRAFFTFHVKIIGDTVLFQYLLPRGEAYARKNLDALRRKDR